MTATDRETGRALVLVGVFAVFAGIVLWGMTEVFTDSITVTRGLPHTLHLIGSLGGLLGIGVGTAAFAIGGIAAILPEAEPLLPDVMPAWGSVGAQNRKLSRSET